MRSLLRNAFKILSAVVVVLTLLAYICPHVNPEDFRWLTFFGTAYPWILLANLLLIALWTWRRNRFAIYHLGIVLAGWTYLTSIFGFDMKKDAVPETAIRVGSHNLGTMFYRQKVTDALREKKAAAYAAFLQAHGAPDILCTQETSGKFYPLLASNMRYPYTFNLKKGTVIFSRYPMEDHGDIPFGKTANSSIWVDVRVGGRLVRIYDVHLQSNKVTTTTEKVIDEGELDNEETWHEIGDVLGKVGNATQIRAEQARRLREHIESCPHPVIVCGDFNDTPNSYVYARLSEGLNDTFRDSGLGLGTTFGGVLPLLRIDYVLTGPALRTRSFRTVRDSRFSDHYPVFASLEMEGK